MARKNLKQKKQAGKDCGDKNCPFHSSLSLRGVSFIGTVISTNMHKTATVEWIRWNYLPKYERYEKKRTKIHAHNPPCIDAKVGERVKIRQCRPLSKTKNFVIVEKIGKERLFKEKLEAREEARVKKETEKEKKKEVIKEVKKGELNASS
jgi:small subunit ribosomal protein S17